MLRTCNALRIVSVPVLRNDGLGFALPSFTRADLKPAPTNTRAGLKPAPTKWCRSPQMATTFIALRGKILRLKNLSDCAILYEKKECNVWKRKKVTRLATRLSRA
ncbi:MAG: hypothetical protein LBM98_12510 [Oscillospiraceae bacterium]|nr:hypothetical protein [Oscillospiraceae bacterium]